MKDVKVWSNSTAKVLAWVLVVSLGAFACVLGTQVSMVARDAAWRAAVERGMREVWVVAQIYWEENRRYPGSIEEGVRGSGVPSSKFNEIENISNLSGTTIRYAAMTNGIEMVATRMGSLLRPELVVVGKFVKEGDDVVK